MRSHLILVGDEQSAVTFWKPSIPQAVRILNAIARGVYDAEEARGAAGRTAVRTAGRSGNGQIVNLPDGYTAQETGFVHTQLGTRGVGACRIGRRPALPLQGVDIRNEPSQPDAALTDKPAVWCSRLSSAWGERGNRAHRAEIPLRDGRIIVDPPPIRAQKRPERLVHLSGGDRGAEVLGVCLDDVDAKYAVEERHGADAAEAIPLR